MWATPSALLQTPCKIITASRCRHCTGRTRSVGSAAVRSSRLRRAELRFGRWTFRSSLRSDLHVHRPALRICPPPPFLTLSAPPRSLDQKAVLGTATQSLDIICAVWATPSALFAPGYCSVGDACRSLRSLCRFPPPSLLPLPRYARAPPPLGVLCVFFGCACRHFGTAYGAAYISARTKAVRSVSVRCGLRPPPGAQRTSDRKKWGPPPHFYFLSDNRFALSLAGV